MHAGARGAFHGAGQGRVHDEFEEEVVSQHLLMRLKGILGEVAEGQKRT